jgi:hypothetical protein
MTAVAQDPAVVHDDSPVAVEANRTYRVSSAARHSSEISHTMLKRLLIIGGLALATACQSTLEALPLEISVTASRATAAPGDTIAFVATIQGGSLLGLDADYGDNTTEQYGTAGARTGKVTFRHAYLARGTFTAKITVTDASAGQKNASVQVRVE